MRLYLTDISQLNIQYESLFQLVTETGINCCIYYFGMIAIYFNR